MKCPHCNSGLLFSEDRGAHCDGCEDFDPETDLPLTSSQRLQCLFAFLDDVIAKDEARTQGEWLVAKQGNKCFGHGDCGNTGQVKQPEYGNIEISNYYCKRLDEDASHIAIGSISQGRNARALKSALEVFQAIVEIEIDKNGEPEAVSLVVQSAINSILSLYPDELLKRYLQ